MKKLILVAVVLLTMVSCKQEKIGYVDNLALMNKYQEKIDIETKFKDKAEALAKKRDSISQAFQIEAQAYQAKFPNPNSKKAQQEGAVLQQKSQFLAQQLQQEDQELQAAGQVEMDSLVNKVKREVKAYGKAQGFSYVLGGGDGGTVLYGTEANDLTDELLKILNDNYEK